METVYIYISPYDILRPRTNQVSDVRFCDGFIQNNRQLHLIVPYVERHDNIKKEDVCSIYGISNEIKIHYLETGLKSDVTGKWNTIKIAIKVYSQVKKIINNLPKGTKVNIVSRSIPQLYPLLKFKSIFSKSSNNIKAIYWAHDLKKRKSYVNAYRLCDYILATNQSILTDLCEISSFPKEKTITTSNPITQEQAQEAVDKIESRNITNLQNIEKPLVVYTGKLAIDYNLETEYILKAAKQCPEFEFLFTGGKPEAVIYWKQKCEKEQIKNIQFTGYIPDYRIIKHYQRSADVLISYYTKQGHDIKYNLPNKICEYMLTGNVIVTPNYPPTAELLTEENCWFALPENEDSLASTIKKAIENKEISTTKAKLAREEVLKNTFTLKVKRVIEFIEK